MKRVVVPELLDTDSGSPQQVADSLLDLRWINKTFGGLSTTTGLLRAVGARLDARELTFLDVGGASGDVADAAQKRLATEGLRIIPTILDRSTAHMSPNASAALVSGDASSLPFRDGSFDVVGSALFLHHLEPHEVVAFINEALRVSRHACIINDLRRSTLHLWATRLGRIFYRSPITSHDSAASVRRAYTLDELRLLLNKADAAHCDFSEHFFFRMGIVVWKKRAQ